MFFQQLGAQLAPYYLHIKFLHLSFAVLWLGSTAVAYLNYLVPVMRAWQRDPRNPERIAQRNLAMERFDHGVLIEHAAFPLLLLSGLALLSVGAWGPQHYWLALKLCIVVLVFLPSEIVDYWLSHFGGNKRQIRLSGRADAARRYEQVLHQHWWFLIVTTPLISVTGLLVLYLAVVKPL